MDIKLAVFDMAGTTVEDHDFVHQALIEALLDAGVEISREEANAVMGYPKPVAISILLNRKWGDAREIGEELILSIHENFVGKMVDFYAYDPRVKEKKGVTETFLELRERGIKVGIDTGFDRKIANTIITRLGWDGGLIDYSVTSDEVGKGRPHPDMIYKLMEKAKLKYADHVAKIGDTLSDLQQGRAAGCRYVIGVTTGAYRRNELIDEYHTHLIEDVWEVLNIF